MIAILPSKFNHMHNYLIRNLKYSLLTWCALLSMLSFGQQRTIELTLIDGFTGEPLTNEEVKIEVENQKDHIVSVTDSTGLVSFDIETERSIQYSFECTSGDFLRQTRNRYFRDDTIARIEFHLYPSASYENRIKEMEDDYLSSYPLTLEQDSKCSKPQMDKHVEALYSYIYDNLQIPHDYGDAEFGGIFLIKFVLAPDGRPRQVEIVSSTDDNLNKEVIRLTRLMPEWSFDQCDKENHSTLIEFELEL